MARNTENGSQTAAEKRAERKRQREAEAKRARDRDEPTAVERANEAAFKRPDEVADAHGEVSRPSRSGDTVIVACKLGVAYFDIQLQREIEVSENTQTGPRTIKRYERFGRVVRLRGTAYPRGTVPDGFPEKPVMVGGAALNFGIDRDFWEAWVHQNKLNPLVMNGMIFASASEDAVRGEARERTGELSGLDPINPKGDARMPKSTRGDLSNIETEESRAAGMNRVIDRAAAAQGRSR